MKTTRNQILKIVDVKSRTGLQEILQYFLRVNCYESDEKELEINIENKHIMSANEEDRKLLESIGITQFIEWSRKPDYFTSEDEESEREIKIAKLMLAMRDWAKFHNGDWEDTGQGWVINMRRNNINIKLDLFCNDALFQIALKTEKLAEKMLKEFEEEIEEVEDWL